MTFPSGYSAWAVKMLHELWPTRPDVAAAALSFHGEAAHPCPILIGDDLDALLDAHVRGPQAAKVRLRPAFAGAPGVVEGWPRLGFYTPDAQGATRWACLDIDDHGKPGDPSTPFELARAVVRQARRANVPLHLERSGSGRGWHVWLFLERPSSAENVRLWLGETAREAAAGQLRRDGAPLEARTLEIFPKQARHAAGGRGLGNMVWAPFWHGAASGGNLFYAPEDPATPIWPERFDTFAFPPATPPEAEPEGESAELAARLIQAALGRIPRLGGRNNAGFWLACQLRDHGLPLSEAQVAMRLFVLHCPAGERPYTPAEAQRSLNSAYAAPAREPLPPSVAAPAPRPAAKTRGERPAPARVQIDIHRRQKAELVAEAGAALGAANTLALARLAEGAKGTGALVLHAGRLMRLERPEHAPLHLTEMVEAQTLSQLVEMADWVKRREGAAEPAQPPRLVVQILHYDAGRVLASVLPSLARLVHAPFFTAHGELVSAPGLHAETGVWIEPEAALRRLRPPPAEPAAAACARARDVLLTELFGDFPFVDPAERAHALAALLAPFVRELIDGPTPLHVVEAAAPGSGKSLLVDCLSLVATGASAPNGALAASEEAVQKQVVAWLMSAPGMIVLDNLPETRLVDSPTLAAVLTAQVWKDRVLRESRVVSLPNRALWCATGNNPRFSNELLRRVVRIRLDPGLENPEERQGFRHADLRAWVRAHRGELVTACLTLIRAWLAAGRPNFSGRPLGSYESWSRVMGGILETAGVAGFLGNQEAKRRSADPEVALWRAFVAAWRERFARPVTASELVPLALEHEVLLPGPQDGERALSIKLGRRLSRLEGRVYSGFAIRVEQARKGRAFSLERRMSSNVPNVSALTPH